MKLDFVRLSFTMGIGSSVQSDRALRNIVLHRTDFLYHDVYFLVKHFRSTHTPHVRFDSV